MAVFSSAERETKSASPKKNLTGIPGRMKAQFENVSGISFDDVRVHYNSEKPARLQAHAYTLGNDVYVAPGQEETLSHELGHVVQQKQGRVPVTGTINGQAVNDDPALEADASKLGHQTAQAKSVGTVIQREAYVNTVEPYNDGGVHRSMKVTGDTAQPAPTTNPRTANKRAFLFEVIAYAPRAAGVVERFKAKFPEAGNRDDVALSLVINASRTQAAQIPDTPNVCTSPMINAEKVTWGHPVGGGAAAAGAPVGSIPYLALRLRAANRPGATALYNILAHGDKEVVRRMGDDDLTFHDPGDGVHDPADPQVRKLYETLDEGASMVTFAYDLKSPDASFTTAFTGVWTNERIPPVHNRQTVINALQTQMTTRIKAILSAVYSTEARFRDYLATEAEVSLYPSEPTTYYLATPGATWPSPNEQQQIKEGKRMKESLGHVAATAHKYIPDISEDTGAGPRNDSLISEIIRDFTVAVDQNPAGHAGQRSYMVRFNIDYARFRLKLTEMDQSYFKRETSGITEDAWGTRESHMNNMIYGLYTQHVFPALPTIFM